MFSRNPIYPLPSEGFFLHISLVTISMFPGTSIQTCHYTQTVSLEKNKYVTASDASTLEQGVLEGALSPQWVQGGKPPENFTFLILKIP